MAAPVLLGVLAHKIRVRIGQSLDVGIGISIARGNIKRNIWAVGRQGSGKMVYWCMVPLPLVDAGPIPDVCWYGYCSV